MTCFADITSPLLSFICSPFSLTLPVTSSTLNNLFHSFICSPFSLTLPVTSSTLNNLLSVSLALFLDLPCLSLALHKLRSSSLSLALLCHTFQCLKHSHCRKEKRKLTPRSCHVLTDFRVRNVRPPRYAPMHAARAKTLADSVRTPDTIRESGRNLLAYRVRGGHYPRPDAIRCDTG